MSLAKCHNVSVYRKKRLKKYDTITFRCSQYRRFTKCQYQVKAKAFHDGIYQIFCSQHHEYESLENSIVPVEIRSVIRDLAPNGLSNGVPTEPPIQLKTKYITDSLINLCHTYNLPSLLAQYRSSTTDVFSLDNINHWSDCQTKDIDRVSKHVEYLNNTLNKTKSDLQLNENRCKKQDETNSRLQQLINDDKQSKKVLQELHDRKVNDLKKQCDQQETNLIVSEQIKLLTNQKIKLKQQVKEVNDLCTSRGEQIEKLESSKNELKNLIPDRFKSDDAIKTLEQDRIRLQTELDLVKRDLKEPLSSSYEELTQECELLQKPVSELEISHDEVEQKLETVQKQNRSCTDTNKVQLLMETNHHLLEEMTILKSNIEQLQQEIQQMDEREPMLLQYSDLHDLIEHQPSKFSFYHFLFLNLVSNNIIIDTQNQMRTNEIPIDLLRKQNDSLKSSLEKLLIVHNTSPSLVTGERYEELRNQSRQEQSYRRYSYSNESITPKSKQTPLWLLNNEIAEQQQAFTETRHKSILFPGNMNSTRFVYLRSVTANNYIPRFSENDYVANGWIKSDPDIIEIETSPKPHDGSWSSSSTRIQTKYD
ncbi:unnamed protein product [Rotaria socialis]|uniref:Uncharacterized protein n=1 Tax=Rotaria socialis TaxID=392032 RepID=A0A820URP6_9BILA|nr:unnamed protein product [Rotaria socialis]